MRFSTFDLAKQRQQFVRAGDRANCSGCRHSKLSIAERTPDGSVSGWRCMKGGFLVTAFAVCGEHQPLGMPANPSQSIPVRPKTAADGIIASQGGSGSEAA